MNKHTTKIHARCPYQPIWDYYELTVSTDDFIAVENIERICDIVRGTTNTQESIGSILRTELPDDCSFTLIGHHGSNCRTVVSR